MLPIMANVCKENESVQSVSRLRHLYFLHPVDRESVCYIRSHQTALRPFEASKGTIEVSSNRPGKPGVT